MSAPIAAEVLAKCKGRLAELRGELTDILTLADDGRAQDLSTLAHAMRLLRHAEADVAEVLGYISPEKTDVAAAPNGPKPIADYEWFFHFVTEDVFGQLWGARSHLVRLIAALDPDPDMLGQANDAIRALASIEKASRWGWTAG